MKVLVFVLTIALALTLTACGGGGGQKPAATAPLAETVVSELAKTAAQELAQPVQVEEALKDVYRRLGLEDVTVTYRDGGLQVAFEQPDLPAGQVQTVYLLVLDVAALNAPFSQQIVMIAKVGGVPWVGITGETADIKAFRQGKLTQQEFSTRLTYSLPLAEER